MLLRQAVQGLEEPPKLWVCGHIHAASSRVPHFLPSTLQDRFPLFPGILSCRGVYKVPHKKVERGKEEKNVHIMSRELKITCIHLQPLDPHSIQAKYTSYFQRGATEA
eukprot:1138807-Pelagomonas_calceolata.AAC.1